MITNSTCRLLRNEEEQYTARNIVRRMYEAQGYDVSNESIVRYLGGPNATTFGLFEENTLYGTISIIVDGEQGLPMDAVYADELAKWRSSGKKLSEVVQFAVDHDTYFAVTGKKTSSFAAAPLFTAVLTYAIEKNIDYLCISVNPKHDRFYSMLGFKQIGEMKHYDSVDAPAIARAFYVPEWNSNSSIARFLGKKE